MTAAHATGEKLFNFFCVAHAGTAARAAMDWTRLKATKLDWLSRRSLAVGLTSFCYVWPFAWGGWPLWLVQAFLSFQSDFVHTGRDSWYHVADRTLASVQTVLFIALCALTRPPWHEVLAAVGALGAYALGLHGIRTRREQTYVVGHTAWHLIGGCGLVAAASRHCDPTFAPDCDAARRFVVLRCECDAARAYAELALFACAVLWTVHRPLPRLPLNAKLELL